MPGSLMDLPGDSRGSLVRSLKGNYCCRLAVAISACKAFMPARALLLIRRSRSECAKKPLVFNDMPAGILPVAVRIHNNG